MTPKITHCMCTKGITKKYCKSKRFRYQQPLLVYTCHMTPMKTYFMLTKEISEKHSKIEDLDIKKHY